MDDKKEIFIVFDGIDGSGKTTQAELLKKYLESKGKKIFATSEPGEGEHGKIIESYLRKRIKINNDKWLELFTKDREENVRDIKEALKEGKTVILDRYYYSTLAYQLEEGKWQEYAYNSNLFPPTIAFILDCDVSIALKRIKQKYFYSGEKNSVFEKKAILTKVRKKFLLLPNYLKDNIKIIDSSRGINEIFQDIRREVDKIL